jgi:type II secretory pathway pseudopilin PulG
MTVMETCTLGKHMPSTRQRGAALLILILVLGMGAAAVLMSVAGRWDGRAAHAVATQQALGQAQDALIGFAILHGRLPRPAVSATDGRESALPCKDDASCTGVLPWVTLGLVPVDGWGHRLRYSVAPDFTRSPIDFSIAVATKTVQSRVGGALRYVAGQAMCERSAQCLPALVWSSGQNNFGISEQGIVQASVSEANLDERANAAATVNLILRAASVGGEEPGGEFDDQLAWVPLLPLINRITATLPGL